MADRTVLVTRGTSVVHVYTGTPVNSDRVEIGETARLRFDELRGRVARIGSTMMARTATPAAVAQADAMLAEIEQQARAARIALARGR